MSLIWTKIGYLNGIELKGYPHNAQATALIDWPSEADLALMQELFGDVLIMVRDPEQADSIVGMVLVCLSREVE